MPGIRARYIWVGLVEAQATAIPAAPAGKAGSKTVQNSKRGHHPDPVRDKAKTSDNLRPQMRFIIHGEGQEQRPPVLTPNRRISSVGLLPEPATANIIFGSCQCL